MSSIKYHPEIEKLEHDDASAPETKRVLAYGWDASGLQKVKLNVDADGKLNVNSTAPVGGATASNQTDGSQKTQIVDAGGEAVTVTGGKLDVNATIDTTGLATSANQTTIIGHLDGVEGLLTTIDADTGSIATSSSSIDAKTPALGQALAAGSVPVVLTAAQLSTLTPLSTVAVTQSGTWDEVGINDSGNSITVDAPVATPVFVRLSDGASAITTLPVSLASVPSHAVTNAGTFAVQVDGAALTSLQLIDDPIATDDTTTHSTGTTKVMGIGAVADPTDASVNANDIGMPAMTTTRFLKVSNQANSGVDIGDVDVTSVIPGTGATNLGKAEDGAHTSGDVGVMDLGVRNDTMADFSGADNDYTPKSVTAKGQTLTANAPRGRKLHQITTITSSTSETTVLTAAASTYHDVYGVIVTNTSSTATEVSFKDATAGTTRFTISAPANDTRGFMLPIDAAVVASGTNANWTATCADSVASIIVTVLAVKNL